MPEQVCRSCGCSDSDGCLVSRHGRGELRPCRWVEEDRCCACAFPDIWVRERGPVHVRREQEATADD